MCRRPCATSAACATSSPRRVCSRWSARSVSFARASGCGRSRPSCDCSECDLASSVARSSACLERCAPTGSRIVSSSWSPRRAICQHSWTPAVDLAADLGHPVPQRALGATRADDRGEAALRRLRGGDVASPRLADARTRSIRPATARRRCRPVAFAAATRSADDRGAGSEEPDQDRQDTSRTDRLRGRARAIRRRPARCRRRQAWSSCSSVGSASGARRCAWWATAVSNRLRTKRALPKPRVRGSAAISAAHAGERVVVERGSWLLLAELRRRS